MSSVPAEIRPQEAPVASSKPAVLRLVPDRTELFPTLLRTFRARRRERRAGSLHRYTELAELGRATGVRV